MAFPKLFLLLIANVMHYIYPEKIILMKYIYSKINNELLLINILKDIKPIYSGNRKD
jgi:hypothetical protein